MVTDLTPDAMLAREEVFAPIAAVLPADDVDDAVAITNGVDYGLVTAAFTRDLGRAIDLMNRIDTGLLKVNAPTSGVDFHAPFGGEKASSMPAPEFTLAADDQVSISLTGLGRLDNVVEVVGLRSGQPT